MHSDDFVKASAAFTVAFLTRRILGHFGATVNVQGPNSIR